MGVYSYWTQRASGVSDLLLWILQQPILTNLQMNCYKGGLEKKKQKYLFTIIFKKHCSDVTSFFLFQNHKAGKVTRSSLFMMGLERSFVHTWSYFRSYSTGLLICWPTNNIIPLPKQKLKLLYLNTEKHSNDCFLVKNVHMLENVHKWLWNLSKLFQVAAS